MRWWMPAVHCLLFRSWNRNPLSHTGPSLPDSIGHSLPRPDPVRVERQHTRCGPRKRTCPRRGGERPGSFALLLEHGATVRRGALTDRRRTVPRDLPPARRPKKIDYRSEDGGNLLLEAAGAGNVALLRELLDRGVPVDFPRKESGDTALLIAFDNVERPEAARL